MDVLGFAAKLIAMAAAIEADKHHALEKAGELVEKEAKSAIGTYKYGWPQLKPETVARKGADTPLLVTGELRESISHKIVGSNAVEVGSNSQKAVWHEMGTVRIPPRPFLQTAAAAKEAEVCKIFEGEMTKALGVGGGA